MQVIPMLRLYALDKPLGLRFASRWELAIALEALLSHIPGCKFFGVIGER
ncbi:hypothetical protein [Phormidium sp. CCY1219]|nr:hypothetical protein [Phormidium sp. CCY1219]